MHLKDDSLPKFTDVPQNAMHSPLVRHNGRPSCPIAMQLDDEHALCEIPVLKREDRTFKPMDSKDNIPGLSVEDANAVWEGMSMEPLTLAPYVPCLIGCEL